MCVCVCVCVCVSVSVCMCVCVSRVSQELCRRFLEASVLLDLVSVCSVSSCDSRQTDDDQIRQTSHWVITING